MRTIYFLELALVFTTLFLLSCNNKTNNEQIIGNLKKSSSIIRVSLKYPVKDSIFKYSVTQESGTKYTLTIETQLIYDSTFLKEGYFRGGNQVVLSQSLIFKYNDSVLSVMPIPISVPNEYDKILNNRHFKLPKYVFTGVNIKETKDDIVYVLYAWELLNSSREINAYYSKIGKLLYLNNCKEDSCNVRGSLSNIPKEIEITDNTKIPLWQIFPPQFAGQKE